MRAGLAIAVVITGACGGRDATAVDRAPAPAADVPLRPAPGADLSGPVAPPAPIAAGARAPATTLDLGTDRPAVPIELPAPPRGGAATFTFGDERRGWVTRIPETNQLPSVAYGDGRVYVSGGFESISFYALDAHDGHVAWASQQLEDNGPTAAIFDNGRVVFNTESCTLFVMDARTGKKLWFKTLGDPTLAQPAVDAGLVYASHPCNEGQCLSAYKLKSGDVAWSRPIGAELLAAPVVHGGAVYATNLTGTMFKLDKRTGAVRWQRALRATTAPWIDGDRVYVSRRGKGGEQQIVVSAGTGKLIAEHTTVEASYLRDVPRTMENWKQVWAFEGSRPVVVDGVKYDATAGFVQAADPDTGDAMWKRRWAAGEAERSLGTVAIAGSQVVMATRTGQIFGLDIDTGYTLWAYDVHRTIVAEPIVADGWVYATTTAGEVIALEVADSTLDGWHMWGGNPGHDGPVVAAAD